MRIITYTLTLGAIGLMSVCSGQTPLEKWLESLSPGLGRHARRLEQNGYKDVDSLLKMINPEEEGFHTKLMVELNKRIIGLSWQDQKQIAKALEGEAAKQRVGDAHREIRKALPKRPAAAVCSDKGSTPEPKVMWSHPTNVYDIYFKVYADMMELSTEADKLDADADKILETFGIINKYDEMCGEFAERAMRVMREAERTKLQTDVMIIRYTLQARMWALDSLLTKAKMHSARLIEMGREDVLDIPYFTKKLARYKAKLEELEKLPSEGQLEYVTKWRNKTPVNQPRRTRV